MLDSMASRRDGVKDTVDMCPEDVARWDYVRDGLPRLRFTTDFFPSLVFRHSSNASMFGSHWQPGFRTTKGGSALNSCL